MNRNATLILHFLMDKILPPLLRDSRWFMSPLFRLALGPKSHHYLEFKERLPHLSEQDIQGYYTLLGDRLTRSLAKRGLQVTGADILPPSNTEDTTNPLFCKADVTQLQFQDHAFDTVICAHTLEHVFDIEKALSEVRRVCSKRLIVVVPRQREYRYTFDLHIHFFPYAYKLSVFFGKIVV